MISGVYVPMLTPFDRQGQVDTGAYGAFAQWLASRGVDGLVPFGSTGEGPSLSMRERLAALAKLPDAVPGTSLILEDICVPPAQIAECARDLQALLIEHGYAARTIPKPRAASNEKRAQSVRSRVRTP